ncbi:hypothetical protein [Kordiimonas lacus]|nr:hypothetical protein [Kordiimonas lacus]
MTYKDLFKPKKEATSPEAQAADAPKAAPATEAKKVTTAPKS